MTEDLQERIDDLEIALTELAMEVAQLSAAMHLIARQVRFMCDDLDLEIRDITVN